MTESVTRHGRIAFAITAALATLGLLMSLTFAIFNVYPSTVTTPTIFGYDNGDGLSGAIGRVLDFASYFTILSNVVVVIVLAALARGRITPTALWRALRMDSLLMITVTGLVYVTLLAPSAQLQGLEHMSTFLEHYLTPVLTVLTFLIWGPRGWFRVPTVFAALIIPILWLVYTFVRGAVIDSYPYPFLDVASLGAGRALVNILGVLILGVVLGFVFLGLDNLLSRRSRARA